MVSIADLNKDFLNNILAGNTLAHCSAQQHSITVISQWCVFAWFVLSLVNPIR